ncbi:unnamed protein product [Sympodiomycopsis kandeliae]
MRDSEKSPKHDSATREVEQTPIYHDAPSDETQDHESADSTARNSPVDNPSLDTSTSQLRSADPDFNEKTQSRRPEERDHTTKNHAQHPETKRPQGNPTTFPADLQSPSAGRSAHHQRSTSAAQVTGLSRTISRIRSRDPAVGRTFGHPLEHVKTGQDCLVEFEGPDDPYKPVNWPAHKKWTAVALYGLTTATVTLDSSIFSAALQPIASEYQVSREVVTLGLSFMLFGFGLGPLIWGPLSELYGRKRAVLIPFAISMVFTFATGASKDIQTVLITRFFSGFFGSAPITNTGGTLGDLFTAQDRGIALVSYAMAVVGGPTLGPLIGGAIVANPSLSWRWTEYITGILKAAVLIADVIVLDESYGNVLLKYKAQRLRITTGNWALHAKHEEWDVSLKELVHKYLVRPFQLLGTPICFCVALYASFVYGILYALLEAIPYVFQEERGWGSVTGALPFLAVLVGISLAAVMNIVNQKYYFKKYQANGNRAVPEARLPPMMAGGIAMCAGMFMYAWLSDPSIFWFADMVALALFGFGFFGIFQAALNYLVDTFTVWGASAIAANTFLRSVFAGTFPLFIRPMLEALGVGIGCSIFAIVAFVLIPIPFVFFIYGRRIRARSVYSRQSL